MADYTFMRAHAKYYWKMEDLCVDILYRLDIHLDYLEHQRAVYIMHEDGAALR